jgi:hypothetical protein
MTSQTRHILLEQNVWEEIQGPQEGWQRPALLQGHLNWNFWHRVYEPSVISDLYPQNKQTNKQTDTKDFYHRQFFSIFGLDIEPALGVNFGGPEPLQFLRYFKNTFWSFIGNVE